MKHTDGTTWLEAGALLALWTIATAAATVFKIVTDGSRATLEPLYGALRGILVGDRAKALGFWAMERRQICWAHLLRQKPSALCQMDGIDGTQGMGPIGASSCRAIACGRCRTLFSLGASSRHTLPGTYPSSRSALRKHTILFLAANPLGANRLALDEEARAIRSGRTATTRCGAQVVECCGGG